jgi:hypothetical protein
MLGHIEDKRKKLPSLEKSLLNALCAAFDLSRSALGPTRVPLWTSVRVCLGLSAIAAKSEGPFMDKADIDAEAEEQELNSR